MEPAITTTAAKKGDNPQLATRLHIRSAASTKNWPLEAFGNQMVPYMMVTPAATRLKMAPTIRPVVITARPLSKMPSKVIGDPYGASWYAGMTSGFHSM